MDCLFVVFNFGAVPQIIEKVKFRGTGQCKELVNGHHGLHSTRMSLFFVPEGHIVLVNHRTVMSERVVDTLLTLVCEPWVAF